MNGGSLMQYLKDEIRQRIMESALIEFQGKGFRDASMRCIAQNAGISSGSVYNYYKNKQTLFHDLVGTVYAEMMSSINEISEIDFREVREYRFNRRAESDSFYAINKTIGTLLDSCKDHNRELFILVEKSKGVGAPYENTKDALIGMLDQILREKLLPSLLEDGIEIKNHHFTYMLAVSFIEGVCYSLRNYENGAELQVMMDQLINILFKDIADRL